MDELQDQKCAVDGCVAPATRQDEVHGKHLRIGGIDLPKATVRVSAWLYAGHDLNVTGRIHLEL